MPEICHTSVDLEHSNSYNIHNKSSTHTMELLDLKQEVLGHISQLFS